MKGEWSFRVALLGLLGILLPCLAAADTPWSAIMSGKRVDADPSKKYILKEEHGPWIIMACSFSGENAEKQARELVLELRKRYRLDAFIHAVDFKLEDLNANAQSINASPHRHQYHAMTENPKAFRDGALKEIAVVVGNFPAVDDPEAQRALQKLKSTDPECLNVKEDQPQSRSLAGWRMLQAKVQEILPAGEITGRKHRGPMAHAFITRNPLLPEEYFSPKGGVDELVLRMNKGVEHSLLDCPGKFTVQVAHFTGEVIMNQGDIRAIESGEKLGPESAQQSLSDAAEKAHDLTEALRLKGWEAYEFHDRYSSLVTVGSFDSMGTPRSDGVTEINPQIFRILETFKATAVPGAQQGAMTIRSLVGIYFDAQPIPVEVPKRSISRALTQRLEMAGE